MCRKKKEIFSKISILSSYTFQKRSHKFTDCEAFVSNENPWLFEYFYSLIVLSRHILSKEVPGHPLDTFMHSFILFAFVLICVIYYFCYSFSWWCRVIIVESRNNIISGFWIRMRVGVFAVSTSYLNIYF